MGFKCPVCHKDFGSDEVAFNTHMEMCSTFDIEDFDFKEFAIKHIRQKVFENIRNKVKQEIRRI